jgi:autophagy-related protein 16
MPDGNQIITNSRDHTVKLIDIRTFNVLQTFENENYYNSNDTNQLGVSPTGKYIALGSKNGKLLIVNIQDNEVEEIFEREHTSPIVGCDWSKKGGSRVASIDSIGNLFVWD